MKFSQDTIFVNEAVTNETKNSEAIDLSHLAGYSVFASWAGTTISGSIKLQASVDGSSWVEVDSSSQTINSDDSYIWNVSDVFYKYFRVQVVSVTNEITVDVKFFAKGF